MKKKIMLLGTTVAMSLGLAGAIAAVSSSGSFLEGRASNVTAGSIVFSRATGSFTKIDNETASVSGRTALGATYYAVSRNNTDISSGSYIAQFGSGRGYDEQYVSFSDTATGTSDFEFQAITGIKVKASSNTTFYAYVSNDGSSFNTSVAVAASTSPSVISLGGSYKYVRLGVSNVFPRNVTSIELVYDCGESEKPSKSPDHIAVYNAKNSYTVGDSFVAPEVRMIYDDSSTEVLNSGVTFSGYDMNQGGEQTVTVSYSGAEGNFQTTYKITVVVPGIYSISYNMLESTSMEYVDMADYLDLDECELPDSFEEGTDVDIKVVLSTNEFEFVWVSIVEDENWDSFGTVDGVNVTLSDLPSSNVTVTLWIGPAE